MKTAQEIFNAAFLFKSVKEMQKEITDAREDCIKDHDHNGRVIFHSDNHNFVVGDTNGRGFDGDDWEPYYDQKFTKKELLGILQDVVDHFAKAGKPVPNFDIFAQGDIYCYESAYDKLQGEKAEPTGDNWGVKVIDYVVS